MSDPFKWDSTPLVNIGWQTEEGLDPRESSQLLDESMAMHKALRPPVESLKAKLGKQAFTWNGEYRFWVWEGPNWRVFASNKHGVSFEVKEGLTKQAAFAAWQDFRKKVGLA